MIIKITPNGDHEMIYTDGTDASKFPNIQQPLTTPNTQPYIQPLPPTIQPNTGINPYPNIGIGDNPFELVPPKPLRQVTDQKEWDELIKSLVDGNSGLSEKERVFDELCQHIPDEIVRELWLNSEEAAKNPIESGMKFLAKYLLTQMRLDSIL